LLCIGRVGAVIEGKGNLPPVAATRAEVGRLRGTGIAARGQKKGGKGKQQERHEPPGRGSGGSHDRPQYRAAESLAQEAALGFAEPLAPSPSRPARAVFEDDSQDGESVTNLVRQGPAPGGAQL